MRNNFILKDGTKVKLSKGELGSGGEGVVYAVQSPASMSGKVVKILHENKRKEREERVRYMVENPPDRVTDDTGHRFIIWPEHVVYDEGAMVGFTMERMKGIELKELCMPNLSASLDRAWTKFDLNSPDGLNNRLVVAKNIARAIAGLHDSKRYIIGDLKPENIMIDTDGRVALIDLDSFQITSDSGEVLFPSKMKSAGYSPPDKGKKRHRSWDNFVLAIVLYEFLFGLNPYIGTCDPPYDQLTAPPMKLVKGLFPHGASKQFYVVIPPPHDRFKELSVELKTMFINCLEDGVENASKRPSAEDWVRFLAPIPAIADFKINTDSVLSGMEVILSWNATDVDHVEIIPHVGKVAASGSTTVVVTEDTNFVLVARNAFGNTKSRVFTRVFPTPFIESLLVPLPEFTLQSNPIIEVPTFVPANVRLNFTDHLEGQQFLMKEDLVITELTPPVDLHTDFHLPEPQWDIIQPISEVFVKIKNRIKQAIQKTQT